MPVTSLCMIQFSKTIPHFVRLYITYNMVKVETKMRVELEDTRVYIRYVVIRWMKNGLNTTVSSTNILEQNA